MVGYYTVITHTDLDGVASAALILKHLRAAGVGDVNVRFAQPHTLHRVLNGLKCGSLYVCDLGVNGPTYRSVAERLRWLLSRGASVYWFDHHVWDGEWVSGLVDLGVKLYLDQDTCTAGIVARCLGLSDSGSRALASAACSNDLWVFNDPLGNFLSRYVACRKGNRWRRYLVDRLSAFNGTLDDEVLGCAEEVVDRDLRVMDRMLRDSVVVSVGNVRVALAVRCTDESSVSYAAHYLMSRTGADVAVICKEGGLSIRSREMNIRDLAVRLGGGGHPRAAGAPLRLPLIYRLLLLLRIKKPVLGYCSRLVSKELREVLAQTRYGAP